MNLTDLRVLRSKKMIREAFIDLVEEKGYENITIKDISEKAMINRKTFYSHFDSINMLFADVIKEHIDYLTKNFAVVKLPSGGQPFAIDFSKEIQTILHHISINKRGITILLNDSSSYELTRQVEKLLEESISDRIATLYKMRKDAKIPIELLSASITAIFIVVVKWWLKEDAYSEEDATRIFIDLVSSKLL